MHRVLALARAGSSAAWVPMLSIGKLATGQADYYLQQAGRRVVRAVSVASGVEDYYFAAYAPTGRWSGAGAAELGLTGEVADDQLRDVLDGGRAGVRPRARRVPGFDVTFSAPKGVSVLFGIGDRRLQDAIVAAHETAVDDALGYLERHAAMGRRGRGGYETVRGSGLVAAAFRHGTSRAADPQLHTHVLVANLVRGQDGRWSALDARRLYTHGKTAGHLYEARLRSELTLRLGLRWDEPSKGIAEPAGVPKPVLRAFSRRRAEIDAELEERGFDGPAAARIATLATRRRKREIDPLILRREWIARALELGFGSRELAELVGDVREPEAGVDAKAIAARLIAPFGLTRDRSTFTRRDAIQAWCEALPPGAPITSAMVEEQVDRFLGSSAVVALHPSRSDAVLRRRDGRIAPALPAEQRYTTAELLAIEQRMLALALAPASAPTATAAATGHALADRPSLAEEQRVMVERLTSDRGRVSVVVGKAGTGKTFALDAARAAWQGSGVRVLGAAVARRAARELEEGSGITSTSLAALQRDLRTGRGRTLLRRAVLVVDEASLVATRDLADLLEHAARANAKVVLVGDDRQLPSIRAGGGFQALASRLGAIELHENRRQTEAWERAALDQLRDGEPDRAIELYREHGRLVVSPNAPDLRAALVSDWWGTGDIDGSVMIAFRRVDVADLNGRARALMRESGRLGSESVHVGVYEFAVGDHVVVRRNERRLGVANGDRGVVVGVDTQSGGVRVTLRCGPVDLPRRYLDHPGSLAHGYAVTGHVAQGMTARRAFVLGTGTLFREWGYVALSRGRTENRFYAVVGEPTDRSEIAPREIRRPPLDEVIEALSRSRAQTLASESLDRPTASLVPPRRGRSLEELRRCSWFAAAATTLDPPERIVGRIGPRPERPSELDRWCRGIEGSGRSLE